jgi:high-affinity gluconate transporter
LLGSSRYSLGFLQGRGAVAAMIAVFNVNPVLMVLACAVGSNTMALMYDGSFLLFQQSFGISIKDTLKTWGTLEFVNSFVSLLVVLGLDFIL